MDNKIKLIQNNNVYLGVSKWANGLAHHILS